MSDLKQNNCFKEAVCIEAMRVFDSCSSQDCLEDLTVNFNSPGDQMLIDRASFIKTKCVEVINTTFQIDPVPFNKGFFTVDLTYTFKIDLEVFENSSKKPVFISGTAVFNKKVILFGSDGNTKHFSSDQVSTPVVNGCCFTNLPRATVSVVDPICLDTKLVNKCPPCPPCPPFPCPCPPPCPPKHHDCCDEDDFDDKDCKPKPKPPKPPHGFGKTVLVTIGMFAIVQLQREVSILIPAYDYCIPQKECSSNTDSPCELFEKIKFPTNEFFPKSLDCENSKSSCCNNNMPMVGVSEDCE